MNTLLSLAIVALLSTIAYSDFTTRTVALWQLGALLLAGTLWRLLAGGLAAPLVLRDAAANAAFLAVEFGLLWLWYTARQGRPAALLDRYIGWGDVVFLLCITPMFPFLRFTWFFTFSSIAILAAVLPALLRRRGGARVLTVPFAGALAVCLAGYVIRQMW